MKFCTLFNKIYFQIKDRNADKQVRLSALIQLIEYIQGIIGQNNYLRGILTAIADSIENSADELVDVYLQEMCDVFKFNRKAKACIVVSEENYISSALRKKYNELWLLPISLANGCGRYDYDYCIICGEQDEYKKIVGCVDDENVIDMYFLCASLFIYYPLTWEIYTKYKESVTNCECLVTGMSYFRNAIVSDRMKVKTCNIANSSQDLYYDFLFFQDAYLRNPHIGEVVIGLAPYSLRYDLSLSKNLMERNRLLFYYNIFMDIHNNTEIQNTVSYFEKCKIKCESLFEKNLLEEIYGDIRSDVTVKDWMHFYDIFNPADASGSENEMLRKYKKPYEETVLENREILKKFIAFALDKDIRVSILIPPYSHWYRERWNKDYLVELRDYLERLSEKYEFQVLDLSEVDLSNEYYGDFAHLNRLGALYVTDLVNEYLL